MNANQDKFTVRNIIIAIAVASIGYGIYVEIPDSPAQSSNSGVSTIIKKVASDGNSFIASLVGDGNAVYVWIILGLVGLLILKSLFSDKKKEKGSVVSSIGSFFQMIFGSLGLTIIFGSVAAGMLLVIIIVAGIADGMTDGKVQQQINNVVAIARNEPLPTVDYAGDECDLAEKLDLLGNTLSRQWVEITLCKDDGPFAVFVPAGTKPQIEYIDEDDRVLNSRPIQSFVEMEYSWGKPGGMPNLYRFGIPRSNNGFDTALRDSVTFLIRAAEDTSSITQPQLGQTSATEETTRPQLKDAPPGEPCEGVFKDLKGCESIVFGRNEKRDHEPPIAFCSVGDGPISMEDIGDGEYRWTPNSENVRGRVFSLKVGESFGGFTCGKPNP